MGAYLANMAGSTGRERELAQIKALADNHTNCSADLASAIHEIRMDGPQDESGLAVRYAAQLRKFCEDAVEESVEPGLAMATLSRKLATLWVQRNGRRFRVYRVRRDKGERRGCRPGSERALILSQQQGRAQLADGKGRCNGLLGFKKDDLLVPRGKRKEKYLLSDVLAQFRKTTENRQKEKLARHGNIRAGANPYPLGSLRLGRLFDGPGDEGQTTIRLGGSGRQVRTYNLSKVGALPLIPGAKVLDSFSSQVDLVVVDSLPDLSYGGQHRKSTCPGIGYDCCAPTFPLPRRHQLYCFKL